MMSENAGRTRTFNPLNNPVMGYGRRGSSASSGSSGDSGNDNQGGRSDGRSDSNLRMWSDASTAAAPAQSSPAFTRKNFSGLRAVVPCRSDVDMLSSSAAAAAAPRGGSSAPTERLEAVAAAAAVTHRLVPRSGLLRSISSLPPPPPLRLPPPPPLQRFAGMRPQGSGKPTTVATAAAATAFRISAVPAMAAPCNVAAAAAFEKRSLSSSCERDRRRDSTSVDGDISDDDLIVDVDDQQLNNAGALLTAAERLWAAAGGKRGALHTSVSTREATSCASSAADVDCGAGYGQQIALASSRHSSGSRGGGDPHVLRGFAASGNSDGDSSSGRGSSGEKCTVPSASSGRVNTSLLPPEVEKRGDYFADDYGGTGDADFADLYDDDEWSDAYDVSKAASFAHANGVGGVMALAGLVDDVGAQEKKRRRGKCGRCPACQIKVDCGRCRYCVHKKVLKQSCLMRKCRDLIHKDHLQRASRLAAMRDSAIALSDPLLPHSLFGSGGRHQPEAAVLEHRKQQQQQQLPSTTPLLPPTLLLQPERPLQSLLLPLQALSQQQEPRLFLPRLRAPQIPSVAQSSRQVEPPPMPTLRRASAITTRPASPTAVLCPDATMTILPYHAFLELPLSPSAQNCGSRCRASVATAAATVAVNEETVASAGHSALTGRRRPRKNRSPRPLRSTPWEPNEVTCDEDSAEDYPGGSSVGKRSLLCDGAEPGVISASAASCLSASLLTTSCRGDNEDAGDITVVEQASGAPAVDALKTCTSAPEAADDDAFATRLSPQRCSGDRNGVYLKTGAVFGVTLSHSSDHSHDRSDKSEQRLPCDHPEGAPSAPATAHCDLTADGVGDCRRLHESSLAPSIERLPSAVSDDRSAENLRDAIGVDSARLDDVVDAAPRSCERSEVGGSDGLDVGAAEESHSTSGVCGRSDDVGVQASTAEGLSDRSDEDCCDMRTDVPAADRAFDERDVDSRDGVDVGPSERLCGATGCSDVVAVDISRNFPEVGGGSIAEVCTAAGELCRASCARASGVDANGSSGDSDNVGASESISAGLRRPFGSFSMDDRDSDIGDDGSVDRGYDDGAGTVSLVVTAAAPDDGTLERVPELVLGPRSYEQEMALELKSAEFVTLSDDFSQAIFDRTFDAAGNSSLEVLADETSVSHPVASDRLCVPGQGVDAGLDCRPMSRCSDVAAVSAAANVTLCDVPLSDESLPPSLSIGNYSAGGSSSSSFSDAGAGRDDIYYGCDNAVVHSTAAQ